MNSEVDDPNEPAIVVVVPTYNERDSLPRLVAQLRELRLPRLRVLVVDDGSPDGTGQVADTMAADDEAIGVLHRTAKEGLGRAYIAGFEKALADGADVVVQMDADLSHSPSVLPEMLTALQSTGAGLVIGSRYVPGGGVTADWPLRRRLLSRWANVYVDAILRLGVHDATAGFKMWRADTLRALDLGAIGSQGYSFQVEMTYRAVVSGCRVVEVPISFADRTHGRSKMTLAVQLESALVPWRLKRSRAGSGGQRTAHSASPVDRR